MKQSIKCNAIDRSILKKSPLFQNNNYPTYTSLLSSLENINSWNNQERTDSKDKKEDLFQLYAKSELMVNLNSSALLSFLLFTRHDHPHSTNIKGTPFSKTGSFARQKKTF
ncbi:MAG: hypothetical protein WBQ73_02935 [Candidatus Babeliales bacterium]